MQRWQRWAASFALACGFSGAAAPQDFDTSAGNLLAVLRESPGVNRTDARLEPIGRVQVTLADGREVEIAAAWFNWLGDMHVRFVFDGERSMQSADPGDFERLHLTPDAALDLASANLRRRYGSPRVQPYGGGLMQVVTDSPDLASSYLLDRAFWLAQEGRYPDGLVAAVPQRGGLLFAPANDEAAIAALRFSATAIYVAEERRRVSSGLYLFRNGRWSVYQPPQHVAATASPQ